MKGGRPLRDSTPRRLTVVLVGISWVSEAHSHGFAERFDLPIPIELFLAAAAAAVLVSFGVVAVFAVRAESLTTYPRLDLLRVPVIGALGKAVVLNAARVFSALVFILVIVAGFIGNPDPYQNLAPTVVWILFWVGLAYVCALGGDLWRLINPWQITYAVAERFHRRLRPGREFGLGWRYPNWLGTWPAALSFFAFTWFELASTMSESPIFIASAMVAYSALTWAGMFVFGPRVWLRHGEAFTVVFSLFAAFAPTEVRRAPVTRHEHRAAADSESGANPSPAAEPERTRWQWSLRPPAVGLFDVRVADASMLLMTFLVVTTVTFDGFIETKPWKEIVNAALRSTDLDPLFATLWSVGVYDVVVVTTAGLVAFPLLILAAYLVCVWLMARMSTPTVSTRTLALRLAVSMIPIAIGYHLAHYLSLFVVWAQLIIPLSSDPFGFGWDLFGTVGYQIDPTLIDAELVWYASVVSIVVGHMLAVYVAHVIALRVYGSTGAATRSQIPLLPLMLGYTVLSLWIVAQPVVH